MGKYVIPTANTEHLGKKFERDDRPPFSDLEVLYRLNNMDGGDVFPNGEPYTRFDSDKIGEEDYVAILHSSQPNPETVKKYCGDVLDVLKNEVRPGHVDLIMTHCAEQMQDDKFNRGEANSAKNLISNNLELYSDKYISSLTGEVRENLDGMSMRIVVLNPHYSEKEWVKPFEDEGLLKILNISDRFKEVIEDRYDKEIIYVGPDNTAKERFNADASLEKVRKNSTDITHENVWYNDLADMVLDSYEREFDPNFSDVKEVLKGKKKKEGLDPDHLNSLEGVLDKKILGFLEDDSALEDALYVIMDDTIETGGTQDSAIRKLKEIGAEDVVLASVHVEDIIPVNLYRRLMKYEDSEGSLKEHLYKFYASKIVHNLPEVKGGEVYEEDYSSKRHYIREVIFEDHEDDEFRNIKMNWRGLDYLMGSNVVLVSNSTDIEKMGVNLGNPNITDNIIDTYPKLSDEVEEGSEMVG